MWRSWSMPITSSIIRAQGTYASDEEISRVTEHVEAEPEFAPELVTLGTAGAGGGEGGAMDRLRARDDLYEQAIEVVVREGRGSTSLLQRALGIGYGRAARLIETMEEQGIIGAADGSRPREVLISSMDEVFGNGAPGNDSVNEDEVYADMPDEA